MSKQIRINPLTRISGFMEIDVTLEQNVVTEARTSGNLFRGFEQMMVGRNPFDAIYLTQRICGICSTAHSVASSLALEDALGVQVSEQGRYLRDIIHGCEFLQNHLRHFYQYTIPDFVRLPPVSSLFAPDHDDFRLPAPVNEQIAGHYIESLQMSRLAHEMLAVLGGKAPHNHGVFVGGGATPPTADQVIKMKALLAEIARFIREKALPDVYTIGRYYEDCFAMGRGPGNLLSFGVFDRYETLGTLYVEPLVYVAGAAEPARGGVAPLDPGRITESIETSYYSGPVSYRPREQMTEPQMPKEGAYSWVKAPRYDGLPFESGPLARLWLSGAYRHGISAMDRSIARVLEAEKIASILGVLLDQVRPGEPVQQEWALPQEAGGAGLVDTTRGALGHWLKIENQVLSFYQIITPSAWNFSTRNGQGEAGVAGASEPGVAGASEPGALGVRGTAEQALVGTSIANPEQPVELGRIIRSFDPCMSCATHLYRPGQAPATFEVVR